MGSVNSPPFLASMHFSAKVGMFPRPGQQHILSLQAQCLYRAGHHSQVGVYTHAKSLQ